MPQKHMATYHANLRQPTRPAYWIVPLLCDFFTLSSMSTLPPNRWPHWSFGVATMKFRVMEGSQGPLAAQGGHREDPLGSLCLSVIGPSGCTNLRAPQLVRMRSSLFVHFDVSICVHADWPCGRVQRLRVLRKVERGVSTVQCFVVSASVVGLLPLLFTSTNLHWYSYSPFLRIR